MTPKQIVELCTGKVRSRHDLYKLQFLLSSIICFVDLFLSYPFSNSVIVATIRVGAECQSLTLRTNIVTNPISTPFNQVLSWLCQRRDYYTAATVALSLLDDAVAVYELCGISKSFEDESTHHKGLLDGIKPLLGDVDQTLTSLADMTVGCLIKGGVSMSKTLEGFLARNTLYSAPRACLMLVGVTASAVARDSIPKIQSNNHDNIVKLLSTIEDPSEDVLWPIRCLIKMAVVRNCLPSAILMLNATIPNELRWRAPKSRGMASTTRPSLGLFLALMRIILESSVASTRLVLNLMDEESGSLYWFSIDDDTRLALCLMSIRGRHVMVQEPEVREWVLDRLGDEIESPADSSYGHLKRCSLPNEWLREIVTGSFCNADYDILGLDTVTAIHEEDNTCYRQDMLRVQCCLAPPQKHSSGGLDYDIIIGALLILASRGCDCWRDGAYISVQTLLNAVCNLAGRTTDIEPKFVFDSAKVLHQCALADNLQGAAFLLGGRKGLILECAELLVSNLDMSVIGAESVLYMGSIVELERAVAPIYEKMPAQNEMRFTPNAGHKHILWLIQEHILNVHTYGEFESSSHTGKITPVFAGRVCFRAWYCLTHTSLLGSSAKWLEGWLREQLDLSNGKSLKRLACAALVRILLWADEADELDLSDSDDKPLLATVIGFDGRFMADLAQVCCGLIQSIPSHLSEELMSSFNAIQ